MESVCSCTMSVQFCYMQVARNQTNTIRVFKSWNPPSNKNDTGDRLWALVNVAIHSTFHNIRSIFGLDADLLAFREELCSMGWLFGWLDR